MLAQINKNWFNEPLYTEKGFISYTYNGVTYKLWYGKVGKGIKPPVLVLHGGPGGNHHNLIAFQALSDKRTVIFYDQLGCGNSDRPDDSRLWTAERYFDEVEAVRKGLGFDNYHLVGHSWGTTLATAFAYKYPEGMLSLSLHSPIVSFPYYLQHISGKLKASLPGNAAEIIDTFEFKGEGNEKQYKQAVMEHVKRSVVRTWPLPEPMKRLIAAKNHQLHKVMVNSNSELNVFGNLKNVDVSEYLKSLSLPILLTCGEYDLCTPEFTHWHHSLAPHAEMYIIDKSAHMILIDNPTSLLTIQSQFLVKHDQLVRK
ncbi:MAG: proline iminopeptidase-family hydrolase [Candidatus Omnitrophica bacterium]|nr:proline iminopeptidase-family hydrolase [Candidatus Omnitrophota bacterium]